MKTKNFGKKLQINKSTVSNLSHDELSLAQGGTVLPTYDYWCILLTKGPCTTDGENYCIPDPTTTV